MPSRSTRGIICSRLLLAVALCVAAVSLPAAESIPYQVTAADRFSTGRQHGRDVYEGKGRGDLDWEPMREVPYADRPQREPPVQVVKPSAPPPVYQVVVRPEPAIVLAGEDKVFDRIRLDLDIQRCIFQNICTEEVKAIPGVYLGDRQAGDEGWQDGGEAEGAADSGDDLLDVITEQPSSAPAEVPVTPAPGRVFVEEPVQ